MRTRKPFRNKYCHEQWTTSNEQRTVIEIWWKESISFVAINLIRNYCLNSSNGNRPNYDFYYLEHNKRTHNKNYMFQLLLTIKLFKCSILKRLASYSENDERSISLRFCPPHHIFHFNMLRIHLKWLELNLLQSNKILANETGSKWMLSVQCVAIDY